MRKLIIILFLIGSTVYGQENTFIDMSSGSVTVHVKDTTDYSRAYIDELFNWDTRNSYILNEDTLLINGLDEYFLFDTTLDQNKKYSYQGAHPGLAIHLDIIRINYTTIKYNAKILKGEIIENISGTAHGGLSILASESDEDNGEAYFCTEYFSNWINANHTIRIDSEKGDKLKLIVSGNSSVLLDLSECPILRLQN